MLHLLLIAAGGLFVILWILAAGMLVFPKSHLPLTVRFTSGAVIVSTCVCLILALHAGYLLVWLAIGAAFIAAAIPRIRHLSLPDLPRMNWWFRALFAGYGLVYLTCAFAPEIQPDAATYHLGLVYEYVRLHAFSRRAEFYQLLPQGVEMLFVPAFSIGLHSAAKLVHCSFLAATVSAIRHIGRALGISDTKACCAAAIFLAAPVTAVDGTSAYTDAALVCCCCTILYLAIRWTRDREQGQLVLAALNAGFCYAIKPTFGWVTVVALLFFLRRSPKAATLLTWSGAAAIGVLPWMIRAALLTGSPFAPFLNAWFPNPGFTADLERELMSHYSAFRPGFSWGSAFLDYTVRGGNQGMLGPAFLCLPLALLALRTRAGRWLVASSLLLAVPVLANTGTRFLLPAAAIGAIALVSAVPVPAAAALLVLQMVGSAIPVVDRYDFRYDWRLHEIPWRAALRIEHEPSYLRRSIGNFDQNKLVEQATPRNARIYSLTALHEAYLPREVLFYWHSALADRILRLLAFARESKGTEAVLLSWQWPAGQYSALRVTPGSDIRILDAQFNPGSRPVSDITLLPRKAGHSIELPAPGDATGADLLIWPATPALPELQAQGRAGSWATLTGTSQINNARVNVQRDATAFIQRSGYRYILLSAEKTGVFVTLAEDMRDHPSEWGLVPVDRMADVWLFRIN